MKINKYIFVTYVILVELAFIAALVYYILKFNNQNEKIADLLIILIVSGSIGTMFFLPTFLNSKDAYALPTAFVNYAIMIFESVTLLFGLTLFGNSFGNYGTFYLFVLYAFFGLHMFSYSKSFLSSLIQLIIPLGYICVNFVGLKMFSQTTFSSFESIYISTFKNGYIFSWSLIIGGLIIFGRFWYMSLNINKNKQELEGLQNLKTLYIPFVLYIVFIFIPGVWYMRHGFENFFEFNGSFFTVLIDIVYFVFLIYMKSQNLSNQFGKYLTGKYEKATP